MTRPTHCILAGDIGGTHSRLALYQVAGEQLDVLAQQRYPSQHYATLHDIIDEFLADQAQSVQAACLGVAGPVHNNSADMTNLPWEINATRLANQFDIESVFLLNDLEAIGWGLQTLQADDLLTLQSGDPAASGNKAIIAAGTGLGEAGLFFDGNRHQPFACEGGHTDFSPQTELDMALLRNLQKTYDHVSWERLVSGGGLVNIHACLSELRQRPVPNALQQQMDAGDPAAVITSAALKGRDKICLEALQYFVHLYGVEAGNLALKLMATGGVYIAGGIAKKILDNMQDGSFTTAFCAKGRMRELMERIPVHLVLNKDVALQGTARCAATRLHG